MSVLHLEGSDIFKYVVLLLDNFGGRRWPIVNSQILLFKWKIDILLKRNFEDEWIVFESFRSWDSLYRLVKFLSSLHLYLGSLLFRFEIYNRTLFPLQVGKFTLQSTNLPRPEPIRLIETKTAKTLANNNRRVAGIYHTHEETSSKDGSLTEDSGVGSHLSGKIFSTLFIFPLQ